MYLFKNNLVRSYNLCKQIISKPDFKKITRINFAITYRCNSRCKTCSIWQKYRKDPDLLNEELDLNQIKAFFDQVPYFTWLDEINLTGGEPFLRPDFIILYRYLRNKFPRTRVIINSNGLESLKEWDLDAEDMAQTILVFSLDGLGSINDSIRGIKGSYEKVMKNILAFKKRYSALRIGISFTILPDNYSELKKVFQLSRELKLSFTMRFASKSEMYYNNVQLNTDWTPEQLERAEDQINSIIKELTRSRTIRNRFFDLDIFFYSKMVHYQRNQERLFQCFSGTQSFFMDPYGNIFLCIFSDFPVGNIKTAPFEKIWNSDLTKNIREDIKMNKCHCWTECETRPSLKRNIFKYKHYGEK